MQFTVGNRYQGWQIFDYYQWLLDRIHGHLDPYYNYSLLLHELHETPFKWSIELDENRAHDGMGLRWIYMDERNVPDLYYKDGIQCSVLEMLIGLAIKCNEEIIGEPDSFGNITNDDKVAELFWTMIDNLDLMKCSDDHFSREYVHQQIDIWLNRTFKKNGDGSPFPLKTKNCSDQRKVQIWFQMCGFLNENSWV